jgi:hypothetical protein
LPGRLPRRPASRRKDDTHLALTVGIAGFERMRFGGPYATDEQLALIAEWIDDGMPD